MLTPEIYKKIEEKNLVDTSIALMMAYSPRAFVNTGYQIEVSKLSELRKFVDHNFEPGVENVFLKNGKHSIISYENAFTSEEKSKFRFIQDEVGILSEKYYNRKIKPLSNLLVQLGPHRAISMLNKVFKKKEENISVFEIGAGHGYLGGLLSLDGYRYYSYDVTQSLYLFQSHLLQQIAKNDFIEYVDKKDISFNKSRVGHLPWWDFCKVFEEKIETNFDIVYSNSNLGEMSNAAIRINVMMAKRMLEKSDLGIFMFFSEGSTPVNNLANILNILQSYGFKLILEQPFFCLVLNDEIGNKLFDLFKDGVTSLNENAEKFGVQEFMDFSEETLPLDYKITKEFYIDQANEEKKIENSEFLKKFKF